MKHKIIAIPLKRKVQLGDIRKKTALNPDHQIQPIIGTYDISSSSHNYQDWEPQQILLLSDISSSEDIKDGDWRFCSDRVINGEEIMRYEKGENLCEKCQRIIAAYPGYEDVPQLQVEFLEEWSKNPVSEVEISCFDDDGIRKPLIVHNLEKGVNEVICHISETDKKMPASDEEEGSTFVGRSELWNEIYVQVKQLPRASVVQDAVDHPSLTTTLEKMFYKFANEKIIEFAKWSKVAEWRDDKGIKLMYIKDNWEKYVKAFWSENKNQK